MTPSACPRVPLVAALSLILASAALPGLAGPATPVAALSDAPAVVERPSDGSIDWQSLQDIVLDRLRDAPAPTDAAAPAGPISVQCVTPKGACMLSVSSPVAFGMPCRCANSDAPGSTR